MTSVSRVSSELPSESCASGEQGEADCDDESDLDNPTIHLRLSTFKKNCRGEARSLTEGAHGDALCI
jgi:hypothetical protein